MNYCQRFWILTWLLLLNTSGFAQHSKKEKLSAFKVADGLELSLWASEPLLANPVSMDIDHKGRIWVCESTNNKSHRIVVLADTDLDGKADKSTTFYQDKQFRAAQGIAIAPHLDGKGCKVYVCHSPHIYVFEDNNGDLKADGKPMILLTGFKGIGTTQGVHGIKIGPDGKFYFTVGEQGVENLQSADGQGRKWTSNTTDCRAGTVWRCDLDGTNLELIANNFHNPYEPAIDSFGTIFVADTDNRQSHLYYVMPGGDYGYQSIDREQPGIVPPIHRSDSGSPRGMCMYEGKLLPKKYRGLLLVDTGQGVLKSYHLKPYGAGYKVTSQVLVSSTDKKFGPSGVCISTDGSVIIAADRIYRLASKDRLATLPIVDVNGDNQDKTLVVLSSPNRALRYIGFQLWTEFIKRFTDFDKLGKMRMYAATSDHELYVITRAYWTAGSAGFWKLYLRDKTAQDEWSRDIQFRAAGGKYNHLIWFQLRSILSQFQGYAGLPKGISLAIQKGSLRTTAPDIQREVLLALKNDNADLVKDWILQLAKKYDGRDRFYLRAIGIAVGKHDLVRRKIILKDFDKHFPEWNNKVLDLIWELKPPNVTPRLEKLLYDKGLKVTQRVKIVNILATYNDYTILQKVMTANEVHHHVKRQAALVLSRTREGSNWLMAQQQKKRWSDSLAEDIGQILRESAFRSVRDKARILFLAPQKVGPEKR